MHHDFSEQLRETPARAERDAEVAFAATQEAAISDILAALRHDEARLAAYLAKAEPAAQLRTRIVAIRVLGSARGARLCGESFIPADQPFVADLRRAGAEVRGLVAQHLGATAPLPPVFHGVVQRRGATLYRQHASDAAAEPEHPAVQRALARAGQGAPLPAALRQSMEQRFGVALAAVRLHCDAQAAQAARALAARAFTVGEDIFFAEGAFAPADPEGERLLVHELAHVVQGYQGRAQGSAGVSDPSDPLELEAEREAQRPTDRDVPRARERPAVARAPGAHTSNGRLFRRHLTINESVTEYQRQINPAGEPAITPSGQFYWSDRLKSALAGQVHGLVNTSGLQVYYGRFWSALPVPPLGVGVLERDVNALLDAIYTYNQGTTDALLRHFKDFVGGPHKAESEVKDFAALLGPAVVTGGALYQTCWAGYLLHGKILDFAATGNQRYRTFPMLRTLYRDKEAGACGETAGILAGHFATTKKGFSAIDADKKRDPAKNFAQGLRKGIDKQAMPRGDVMTFVPLAGVIAKLKIALDDGFVFVARVASGARADDMLGGDSFEHSITIIGYDGNEFVFWDPDSHASEGAAGQGGFGRLYYDAANNRLTTARSDADMAVNADGAHLSHPAQHRYQAGSLIGK